MTRTMRNNIIIVVVVVLLSCIAGFAAAKYFLKETPDDNKNTKTNEVDESKKEIETEVKKTIKKEYTLFNTEATLNGICSDINNTKTSACNKDLGKFTLGEVVHTVKINYNLNDPYNEIMFKNYSENYPDDTSVQTLKYAVMNDSNSNYISIDYKKINIEPFTMLDKIVKIDEDYLAIGMRSMDPLKYIIKVYDSGLNLVKEYNGTIMPNSKYTEYFNVNKNTFTRYACICKNNDPNDEYIQKYRITIKDGKFNEEKISEEKAYCMQQCD